MVNIFCMLTQGTMIYTLMQESMHFRVVYKRTSVTSTKLITMVLSYK